MLKLIINSNSVIYFFRKVNRQQNIILAFPEFFLTALLCSQAHILTIHRYFHHKA